MNPLLEVLLKGLPAAERERYRRLLEEQDAADAAVGREPRFHRGTARARPVTPDAVDQDRRRYVIAVAYELDGRWQATVPGVADLVVTAGTKQGLSSAAAEALAQREGRELSDYVVHLSSS